MRKESGAQRTIKFKTMKRLLKLSLIIALTTLFACNKDEVIVEEDLAPVIALDSETDIYFVKAGKSLTVTPR